MSAHPAQVRDAIQLYIEQAYRPVLRFHVQKAVTDRLGTYTGQAASQMRHLERDGKIAKHVSPGGTEYWYSPKSETSCGTCGALALPGVHPDPDCNRHVPAPGGKPTGTTEVSPGHAAILIRYAVQAAEGEAQVNPPPDGETPAASSPPPSSASLSKGYCSYLPTSNSASPSRPRLTIPRATREPSPPCTAPPTLATDRHAGTVAGPSG